MIVKRVDLQSTLNSMYRNLSAGDTRKLENFDGRRHISVYRGKDFLNKTVIKLKGPNSPFMMLVNTMKNIGTKSEPNLVTHQLHLRTDVGDVFVYMDKYLYGVDGMHVEARKRGVYGEPFQRAYQTFEQMRKDKEFMDILELLTGMKLTKANPKAIEELAK